MNYSAQHRQFIRTIVCGSLLTAIFVYFSAPRLIVDTDPDWFPADSAEIGSIQQLTALSARGHQSSGSTLGRTEDVRSEVSSQGHRRWTVSWSVAGFPFDAVHQQRNQSSTAHSVNHLALSLDVLAFLLIIVGGSFWAYHYHTPNRHRAALVTVWTGGAVLFAIGVGWHFWESNARMTDLARLGRLQSVESVKHVAFQWLPRPMRQPWTHLYSFSEHSFDWPTDSLQNTDAMPVDRTYLSDSSNLDALGDIIARHPVVQAVALEGDVSGPMQRVLGSLKFLHTLRWSNVPDPGSVVNLLQQTRGLRALRVSFAAIRQPSEEAQTCNSSLAAERQLDFRALPRLQKLSVTGVEQSEIATDGLSHSELTEITLEFVGENRVPIVVAGMPKLKALRLAAVRSAKSSVAVEVRHVPELQFLMVPVFRPIDLQIANAPKLKTINTTFGMRHDLDMAAADFAPWFTSLDIQNAQSLTELSLTTVATHHWNIEGCPNLHRITLKQPSQQRLTSLDANPDRIPSSGNTASVVSDDLAPVWKWLENDRPLNEISIEQMDLRAVDFASWKRMKFLKKVSLSRCKTKPGQIKQLASIASLTQICADDVKVDDETVNQLLAGPQQWENLNLNWSDVREIRIVDKPRLRSAFGPRSLSATSVHLVNLPRFSASVQLRRKVDELVIENVPEIASLIFLDQFPANARLSGISGLREFCARDAVLNAEQCKVLAEASFLQSLMLPGCQVAQDLVSHSPQWKRLMSIDWTGLKLTEGSSQPRPLCDDDCKALGTLKSLVYISLDHTDVGAETIRQLACCDRLQALSLANCLAVGDDLAPLVRLRLLMELQVESPSKAPSELTDAIASWSEGSIQDRFENIWGGRQFVSRQLSTGHRGQLTDDRGSRIHPKLGRTGRTGRSAAGQSHRRRLGGPGLRPSPNVDRRLAAQNPGRPGDAPTNTSPQ